MRAHRSGTGGRVWNRAGVAPVLEGWGGAGPLSVGMSGGCGIWWWGCGCCGLRSRRIGRAGRVPAGWSEPADPPRPAEAVGGAAVATGTALLGAAPRGGFRSGAAPEICAGLLRALRHWWGPDGRTGGAGGWGRSCRAGMLAYPGPRQGAVARSNPVTSPGFSVTSWGRRAGGGGGDGVGHHAVVPDRSGDQLFAVENLCGRIY